MEKKRNPVVAALFSAFSPGLGFLYLGKPMLAIGLPLSGIAAIVLLSWTRLMFNPAIVITLIAIAIVVWVGTIVAAPIIARRQGEMTLSKSQRWYVYIAFIIVSSMIGTIFEHKRAHWLGYEPYRFPSRSMAPMLLHGDFIVADTWKYRTDVPRRGDVIVFRFPPNPAVYYAKRVIGLPGDRVLIKDRVVYVNGEKLDEPYVVPENNQGPFQDTATFEVPLTAYFVLGDNRDHSNDSRYWGFVPADNVAGRVEYIWFSWDPKTGLRSERIGKVVS